MPTSDFSTSGFRPDIHALRALAVSLVLAYHIWPQWMPGGYIGVDVFFVISGFLITSHLLAEAINQRSINLFNFWARRIRRLLPAACTVLVVCLLITYAWLPDSLWQQTLQEVVASAFYLQNWLLAANSIDYFSVENEASLVQHYWSLSVEEQFYIFWPILLLGTIQLGNYTSSRTGEPSQSPRDTRTMVKRGLLAVFTASLIYSIYASHTAPGPAYFSTATRAWQFAAGGLLIFLPSSLSLSLRPSLVPALRNVTACAGVALIVGSALLFTGDTIFPGYMALLPTIGAAMIVWSEAYSLPTVLARIYNLRPVVFLGDISYSAYLWHWPLIVAFPFIIGHAHSVTEGLAIAFITVLLSWWTKVWIEDPVRKNKAWAKSSRPSYLFALGSMLSVLLFSAAGPVLIELRYGNSSSSNGTFKSVGEIQNLTETTLVLDSWPEVDQPAGEQALPSEWLVDSCVDITDQEIMDRCTYGNLKSKKLLLVVGDSWATHFLPAIRYAFEEHWKIQVLTKSQCPLADVRVKTWSEEGEFSACRAHREEMFKTIEKLQPDLIFAADSPISTQQRLLSKAQGAASIQEMMEGTIKTYSRFKGTGIQTILLESPPRTNCRIGKTDSPRTCDTNNGTRLERRLIEMRTQISTKLDIPMIDTTFWVCSKQLVCPQQIGSYLVKADTGHFAGSFSRRLGGLIKDKSAEALEW